MRLLHAELCPPKNPMFKSQTPVPQNVSIIKDKSKWDLVGHVRTQQEGGYLRTKERGLGRNESCRYLDLGLLVSSPVRKSISIV